MKLWFWLVFVVTLNLCAQPNSLPIQDEQVIRLWSGAAPGAQGDQDEDIPSMSVYLPRSTPSGMTGVIILPGGGYRALALNHEGRQVANHLNAAGLAAFVVKYRLGPRYHHPVEMGDAQRAIRVVRSHAADWHINPGRIGIMGFSAGGHLAATISTHFNSGQPSAADPVDRAGSRPDFAILAYPVISLTEPWTHQGSKTNLLGENAPADLARSLSADRAVTQQTPPTFIFQTNADTTVPAENAVSYYLALRKAGVPAEMHIFENGPHGVGLALDDPALSRWPALLLSWLRTRGFVK
ncbi:MAG TPA: alpha/beta hydrolase [Bryobacteraceae bacterium]|jgi:acetyl esterase/lipase